MSSPSLFIGRGRIVSRLLGSPLFTLSLAFLVLVVISATFGAWLAKPHISGIDIAARNQAPFVWGNDWQFLLGSDSLGRSLLIRLIYASGNTLQIAIAAVVISFVIGGSLGIWAGYVGGWQSTVIMRATDAILSFPVLLLAILLLYILQGREGTIVLVLAFSRLPLFLRVARAEVIEVRERLFVAASLTIGSRVSWIIWRHILPNTLPTLLTVAALEIAFVMLSESSLSFIGLGVQAPEISWGLMVSQGTQYLGQQWWLAIIPGLMIVLTALSLNIVVSWFRLHADPRQKWRTHG